MTEPLSMFDFLMAWLWLDADHCYSEYGMMVDQIGGRVLYA